MNKIILTGCQFVIIFFLNLRFQRHLKILYCPIANMQGLTALEDYDSKKLEKSLKMLLNDKSNEFREIANGIGYPTTKKDWELLILNFCLDFSDCFMAWSSKEVDADHMKVHKCNTMMRQIGLGKSNMTEVSHIQNIAYRISEDFKEIYKRIE